MGILATWFELSVRWRLPFVILTEKALGDDEYHYQVSDRVGEYLGEIATTMLPDDRVIYVRGIEIKNNLQRKRYGAAAVFNLARQHAKQIVPVKETGPGKRFWYKMRKWAGISFAVGNAVQKDDLRSIVASRGVIRSD